MIMDGFHNTLNRPSQSALAVGTAQGMLCSACAFCMSVKWHCTLSMIHALGKTVKHNMIGEWRWLLVIEFVWILSWMVLKQILVYNRGARHGC